MYYILFWTKMNEHTRLDPGGIGRDKTCSVEIWRKDIHWFGRLTKVSESKPSINFFNHAWEEGIIDDLNKSISEQDTLLKRLQIDEKSLVKL